MLAKVRGNERYESMSKRHRHSPAVVNRLGEHSEEANAITRRHAELRVNSTSVGECSALAAMSLIYGKWKTRILSRLENGPIRLGELHRMFPQATKKMLAQHLRELERDGIVIRKDLSDRVLRVEYLLSDPDGIAILRLIVMLRDWGDEHLPFTARHQK